MVELEGAQQEFYRWKWWSPELIIVGVIGRDVQNLGFIV